MKYLMFILILLIISISSNAQEPQKNYTLLLLPFEDRTGIENPLLAAFNDTIDFVLSRQTGPVQVRLIPKFDRDAFLARAAAMHSDKTLLDQGLLAAEWADADGLITGSYTKKGTQWSLQGQVYHLREGRKARQEIQIQGDSVYKLLDDFPAELLKQYQASYIALTTNSWKAYEEFRKGHEALENYNFFGALDYYDNALKLDSTLALAYAEQSRIYFMTGQPEQATKAIEVAQKWLSKASPMEQLAIRALTHSWDAEQNGYRSWTDSWKLYGEEYLFSPSQTGNIINMAPGGVWDEPLIHLFLASASMYEGKRAEADRHNEQWFKAIQQRIRAHPEDASLLHETATYCLVIGQHLGEAIDLELKAIEVNPEEYWCGQRYVLGRLYELKRDIEQMLKWATESVQHLPDPRTREENWRSNYGAAWDYLATSLHEGRIPPKRLMRWCEDVLRIPGLHQPYRVRTYYLMAEIYRVMKDDVKMDATLASIGAPRESDWMVIGPFDASEENLFPETPPFEICTNLEVPRVGVLDKNVQWKSGEDEQPLDGLLDMFQIFLKKYYGSSGVHFSIPAIVYSCIYVDVPTVVAAQVHMGGALMKIWLNDNPSPVVEVDVLRPPILDNQLSDVSLAAGLNRFLVATVSGPYPFDFTFRITDPDGNAIPGLKYVSLKEVLESR
jgi:tetratricopeptide (TPR) repeat protein